MFDYLSINFYIFLERLIPSFFCAVLYKTTHNFPRNKTLTTSLKTSTRLPPFLLDNAIICPKLSPSRLRSSTSRAPETSGISLPFAFSPSFSVDSGRKARSAGLTGVDWDMPGCGRAQGLTPADSQSYPRQPHQGMTTKPGWNCRTPSPSLATTPTANCLGFNIACGMKARGGRWGRGGGGGGKGAKAVKRDKGGW